jgi:predicted transposase/invertase (TIGR01784 family)
LKTIDWDSLTFANNYVFQEVLKNKKLCQYLIEKILHIQIKDIRYLIEERHINSARISSKSIRLDVYVENEEGTVLDIEMQVTGDNSTVHAGKDETTVIKGLPLRTRYYQSLISMDMLKRGMEYRELRKSYVIFICTFDPFGKGLPMYHFTYRCKEDTSLEMGDLTENIYLNAKAADKAEDAALSDFLSYVDSGKAGSAFTQAIDAETKRVKNDEEWRERFVTWEMDLKIMCEDAEKKGRLEGKKEKALAIAKNLKKLGTMSDSEIAEVTALPLPEVVAL